MATVTLPFHSRRPLAWLLRNSRRWILGAPPLLDRFAGQGTEIASFLAGRRYEVGVIEHFWCAPYVEYLAPRCNRMVLDLHNVESALHRSCAECDPWPISAAHRRFARKYVEQEKRWLPCFSQLLAASAEDAGRLRAEVPGAAITVYPNALPLVPVPEATEEDVIAFSGNFEYHPNIRAVRYLAREIWPGLHKQFPALKLRLIGKNPQAIAQDVAGIPGIETVSYTHLTLPTTREV